MMKWAIEVKGISKKYKHFQLKHIDLSVEEGTVMGLIGPNGAGKSTIMRIMMGLLHPDIGPEIHTVQVLGQSIPQQQAVAKKDIGYYCEDMRLYAKESIDWHMQFVRSIYPKWDDVYAQELLDRFGLIAEQRVKGLSHGQRVKAMLLMLFARRPKLLILDEPTTGLDPVARHEILAELMRVVEDEQRTILFSSHNTQDVEQICDNITFIDRGQVIESRQRDAFLDHWRRIRLHVPIDWTMPELPGTRIENIFRQQRILSSNQFDDSIPERLQSSGAKIEGVDRMSLDEIFVSCVMQGRGEPK